ncbi:MAG: hypothetical protein IPJ74_15005 [Saprospiraceae bacterium]|nr:hypothetical protein [Saprospiraceae bacterium]
MQVQATLRKDDSKYGLPMPEELAELLELDEEGNRFFHALTPESNALYYILPEMLKVRIKNYARHRYCGTPESE